MLSLKHAMTVIHYRKKKYCDSAVKPKYFSYCLVLVKMYIVFLRVTNFANFAHFKILVSLSSQAYRPVFVHGGHNT